MVILFLRRDGLGHHEVFHHDHIQIGRAASNDLVLDHFRIDAHHTTLIADDGWYAAHEDKHGHSSLLAIEDDVLRLHPFTLELEHYADPTEIAMLYQIEEGDEAMRAVYADWLDDRGAHARAQLLRVQLALLGEVPGSPGFDALAERTYALAARVPSGWRSYVARSAIAIGDDGLEFGLGFARNTRRISGEPYVTMQLTIAGARLGASEVFVPTLVTELNRAIDHLRRLPEIPHPLVECGVPDDVWVFAYRDGGEVVIGARRDPGVAEVRMPMPELRDRIGRVIEIVAG